MSGFVAALTLLGVVALILAGLSTAGRLLAVARPACRFVLVGLANHAGPDGAPNANGLFGK